MIFCSYFSTFLAKMPQIMAFLMLIYLIPHHLKKLTQTRAHISYIYSGVVVTSSSGKAAFWMWCRYRFVLWASHLRMNGTPICINIL